MQKDSHKIRFLIKARGNVVSLIEQKDNKSFLDQLGKLIGDDFVIIKKCDINPEKNLKQFEALQTIIGTIYRDTR